MYRYVHGYGCGAGGYARQEPEKTTGIINKLIYGHLDRPFLGWLIFINGYTHMWFYNFVAKKSYVIIPVGAFCLPRVITTLCHLKNDKRHGEKSYPFDLAFFLVLQKLQN